MYELQDLGRMIADRVRMDAYAQALRETVTPDSVVLDLGTGSGMMAMLACRMGARRVYAVEIGDAIHVARMLADRNGMGDRIQFLHADSTEIELPERADVIVADLRGVLPLHERNLAVIQDARKRHLKPTGTLIPRRDVLRCALVSSERLYRVLDSPWRTSDFGFDLEAARQFMANRWWRAEAALDEMLSVPATLGAIDYSLDPSPRAQFLADLAPERRATAHGICVWFDAELTAHTGFSNAPGQPPTVYGHAFFPFEEPLAVAASDRVEFRLQAQATNESHIWTWDTRAQVDGAKVAFRQSTFFALPLDPGAIRRRAASHVVHLNARGIADTMALRLMQEGLPLGDVALRLSMEFGALYPSVQAALTRVADLAERYGE